MSQTRGGYKLDDTPYIVTFVIIGGVDFGVAPDAEADVSPGVDVGAAQPPPSAL